MSQDPLLTRADALIAEARQLRDDLRSARIRAVKAHACVRAGLRDLRQTLDEVRARRPWRSDE